MTVYTYGVFDLLHLGHVKLLEEAKALGDKLIVGVYSDRVAESFKRKPIIPQEQRLEMVAALRCVDDVELLDTMYPENIVADIVAKGPGADYENLVCNAPKVYLSYHYINSTTAIINKIRNADNLK